MVTGDIVDTGAADEYDRASTALSEIGVPRYVLAGNHDRRVPFDARLPRPGLDALVTVTLDPW